MKRSKLFALALTIATLASVSAVASADNGHRTGGTGSTSCNDGTVSWSPTTLWPPNHKMQTINIGYTDNDGDGDSIGIHVDMITDNQSMPDGSDEMNGSGQPTDQQGLDWSGVGNSGSAVDPGTASTTAEVRAERSGRDMSGRTYNITVTCSDMGGSSMEMEMQSVTLTVHVPHDQGHR